MNSKGFKKADQTPKLYIKKQQQESWIHTRRMVNPSYVWQSGGNRYLVAAVGTDISLMD